MRAAVYKGKNKVAVEEVPDPKIEAPGDAIIRITTAAICGSDLQICDERSNAERGTVFGHENQGTVEEVGKGVVSIKKADRVVMPFNITCEFCMNCARGFTDACLTANPAAPTAGYGYAGDPVEQIKDMRAKNRKMQDALRPGEEKMAGVNCAIDTVGYQAVSSEDPEKEDPMQTIQQITELLNPTGAIGLIGAYFDEDPGGVDEHAKKGESVFPLGALWNKGVSIGQGQAPVKQHNIYLRDLIIAGRAKPSFIVIVSHRLPLRRAVEAYAHFDKRGIGSGQEWTKVLLKPQADEA